ncbi:MAG: class I SAM-dependent methyltransferase [Planctomycetota bacterium]|nr:MAG: class I SAM-dependent methyltransferase [Planctomycetota bacterium]
MSHTPSGETKTAYRQRACPGCSATDPTPALIRSHPAAEEMPFDGVMRQWDTGIRAKKGFFSYHRCKTCGQLYCPVYPDDGQLRQLYGSMTPNMSDLPTSCLRHTQEGYLQTLLRHHPAPGDMIEVGPDRGYLAHAVQTLSAVPPRRFWFIEPNLAVHDDLRASIAPLPCDVSVDLNRFNHIPDATAGIAFMVHVLDHLINPLDHLRELHRCLVPGGLLGIVVHDELSMLSRLLGARHPIYCPYHPQLFNPATLAAMLGKAGFDVVEIVPTRNYYPVHFVARTGLSRFGMDWLPVPIPRGFVLPLKLGNIQIIARK